MRTTVPGALGFIKVTNGAGTTTSRLKTIVLLSEAVPAVLVAEISTVLLPVFNDIVNVNCFVDVLYWKPLNGIPFTSTEIFSFPATFNTVATIGAEETDTVVGLNAGDVIVTTGGKVGFGRL